MNCIPLPRSAFLAPLLSLLVLLGQDARALEFADDHVRADLVGTMDSLVPGTKEQLALRLRHAPHWHTYWTNPGDAGLPTTLRWTLPAGYSAGGIQWPVPRRLPVGSLANYGYEDEVLLPVAVSVPASAAPGGTARLAAHASWLVCSDVCIPGGADVALELPVRAAGSARPGPDAGAIARALTLVPGRRELASASAQVQGTRATLHYEADASNAPRALEFFPSQGGWIVPAAAQRLGRSQGRGVLLDLTLAGPLPADMRALDGVLVADGGPSALPGGWAAQVSFPVRPSAGSGAGLPGSSPGALPAVRPVASPGAAAPGDAISETLQSPYPPRSALQGAEPPATQVQREASITSLLVALGGAFVGGLILNLMPCVFPVLSLKVLALAREGGPGRGAALRGGIAYTVGVVASFLLLGFVMVALRGAGAQIGWGFQLQLPTVIASLLALFFLIGLNLLGAFEVSFGQGLANSGLARAFSGDGPAGSFATGVLAAVVASPCTAPFMGAAMGYAAGQPTPAALAVFAALGAGMAAPFLLLAGIPGALRHLPRPGPWMERLRQMLAFPMFLTCVWLLWVLARQVDVDALAGILAALVALGAFAWALGLAQRGAPRFGWLALLSALLALACVLPFAGGGTLANATASGPGTGALAWQAWSGRSQSEAVASGREVLVDFTAAWCITCQANERYALADARVREALAARGVVLMKADWTLRDEAISRELARFGRSGVPLYVYYGAGGTALVLPELLTPGIVLRALGAG
jgi:thiol:disulfide interchange protein/DsbC/DsbD-like thiol-disulfide interchange protein